MELLTPGSGLIIWQAIIFLALILLLKKFAWGPIISSLKEREVGIEESLAAAEQAKSEMASLKSDNEKLLKEARLERDVMLKDALTTANKIKEEAREETSKISSKMIEDAKATIENEKKAALADIKTQVSLLSLDIAEKLLRKQLGNEKEQKALVDEFVKDLNLN
ncbi:MAG: F0F1 ATP synthase subunit B [Roseivirga sp.]|nr:F0F1 ATP synthase subunit B [Roseivirga sp.]